MELTGNFGSPLVPVDPRTALNNADTPCDSGGGDVVGVVGAASRGGDGHVGDADAR